MSIQINVQDHILYEDDHIIVINKPCSLMVEPDRNGHPNLLQQVKKYLRLSTPKGGEIYTQHIHRLDRPVSGIVLFAKQKAVLKNLSEQFANRNVKKYYQAITTNAPAQYEGTLENWHRKEKKKAVVEENEFAGSEKVTLDYNVGSFKGDKFLWSIELHTGKYHQIRAQLSAVGCPIVGDTMYGSITPYNANSIALHAYKLIFSHPVTNEEIVIEKENAFNLTG